MSVKYWHASTRRRAAFPDYRHANAKDYPFTERYSLKKLVNMKTYTCYRLPNQAVLFQ
jgi:hypothetical protein